MGRTLLLLLAAIAALGIFRMIGPLLKSAQQAMAPSPAPGDPNTVDMVKCPSCGSIFAPGQAHAHAKK